MTPHPTGGGRVTTPPDASMPPDTDPPDDGVAQRLREARRAKGLTQAQVAKHLGVSRRAVSEWETGIRLPHVAIPGLAALYDVTTTFLLYGVEPASAELQALRDDVQSLATAVKSLGSDLAALAETTAATLADVLRLLRVGDPDQPEPVSERADDPERP